jgi:multiple sugar transport system permease protein
MMIPGAVTLIPAFVLMSKLQVLNTYWALILPGLVGAGSIFMLTQFFKAVPYELEEAAFMDGASRFQIYKDVLLPLARPALLTVFILQFQAMWNNFLTPLLYLNAPRMWVLNVALSTFSDQYQANYNLILVGAMFNAIPVLLLFFFFSRYYIEGAAYSGVKG